MTSHKTIIFGTANPHKVLEVNAILANKNVHIKSLADIEYHEDIEETGKTFEENAWIKADTIFNARGLDCFAEDSGLEVVALNNEPGIYTARYAGPQRNHDDNIDKVLANLKDVENRAAQFKSVIAMHLGGKKYTFVGIVQGSIALQRQGQGGFGYDPIFIPKGYNYTFAQLPEPIKNKISHRAKAMNQLIDVIQNYC